MWDHCFHIFFPLSISGERGEIKGEVIPTLLNASIFGDEEQPPNVIPGSAVWSLLQGFCSHSINRSVVLKYC